MAGRLSTVAVVLVSTAAALVAAAFLTGWMVVDVQTHGPDAVDFTVPIPLGFLQAMLSAVPEGTFPKEELPADFPLDREGMLEIVSALATAPAGTSIRVDTPDARVSITTAGEDVSVDVEAPEADVTLRILLAGVRDALERWDGTTLDPRMALALLTSAERGPFLLVDSPEGRVRIDVR